MSTQLKLRKGTTAQHATFTGAEAEVTVDTSKDTLVVHDGVTAGGFPLAREGIVSGVASITSGTITGITDLAVADGGTGASTPTNARTNLDAQQTLTSGTNIKTINGASVLGSGNLSIATTVSDGDKGDITVSSSGTVWTVDAGAITADKIHSSAQYTGFKNRIINGAMVIDQRNNGAEVNPAGSNIYYLDRWNTVSTIASKFKIQQNAGAIAPPNGFKKYLGVTSLSAYSPVGTDNFNVQQRIEGFNVADLNWGAASASTVTLSFWVYSSLTGAFGGSLRNSAANRSYPYTYSVPVANTWTQVSVVIPGDTTGTWVTDNGIGIYVTFALGVGSTLSGTAGTWAAANYLSATGAVSVVGTSGATFYITGVQLEKGSVATGFDYRSYGTELGLCQRYYYKHQGTTANRFASSFNSTTTNAVGWVPFIVPMRTAPTALEQTGTAADYSVAYLATGIACSSVPTFATADTLGATLSFVLASGLTAGQASQLYSANNNGYLAWSAEL